MPISARESLNKLDREVISCKKCLDLVEAGKHPIPGKGASKANIMIVSTFPLIKKHIDNCISYLTREISIITPHIIVSMGLDVSNIILEKYFSIEKKYRDIEKIYMKIFDNPSFKLVPFFDPH